MTTTISRDTWIEINGQPARVETLQAALPNFGHFTSMQVRDAAVAGLALHGQRLQAATRLLFDAELNLPQIWRWLHQALEHAGRDAIHASSVRIAVHASRFDRSRPGRSDSLNVMISVAAPAPAAPPLPQRLCVQRYARELPQIKHEATFGALWQRRLAQQAGCDDALFVGDDGAVSEGPTWNIGLFDGQRIVWPQAPMLAGVTQQVLVAALDRMGFEQQQRLVHADELGSFAAAFLCNATHAATPVAAIDGHRLDATHPLFDRLQQARQQIAMEPIA